MGFPTSQTGKREPRVLELSKFHIMGQNSVPMADDNPNDIWSGTSNSGHVYSFLQRTRTSCVIGRNISLFC